MVVLRTSLFLFWILTLTMTDVVPEANRDSSLELQHLLKWMDSAQLPDARREDFIKLSWVEDEKEIVAYGFKVTDCLGTILIFTDDGRLIAPSMFPGKLQIKISPYNFDARAAQVAESIDAYIETNVSNYSWDSYEFQEFASSLNLHTSVRDSLMARWCIQLGLNDTSSVLWKRAVTNLPELVKSSSIVEQFQAHWAMAVTYRGVAALSNPQISYQHVMSRIDWVLRIVLKIRCSMMRDSLRAALKRLLDCYAISHYGDKLNGEFAYQMWSDHRLHIRDMGMCVNVWQIQVHFGMDHLPATTCDG